MITVHEINDIRESEATRAVWESLLSQTRAASFFQSLDWLQAYWRHFGADKRLRVLMVYEGGQAIGIVPLVVRKERRRLGTVKILTYPLDDWASFYGPIGASPAVTLASALEHIHHSQRDWDLLELPWVDALGSDVSCTLKAFQQAKLTVSVEAWQTAALIDLSALADWEGYWASRTSRWRNNVRRSEKKLAETGRVTYLRYRPRGIAQADADPRWDWYDQCERIAEASWQGHSSTGTTLTHEAIRPFLRDCHLVAAEAGALDLNLLLLDGRPVAFNYAYQLGGYVFGLRTGYDPQATSEGAGSVLQARMIEDCFARGDHTYDLGTDYLEAKRYWLTETRSSYRYTHFSAGAPWAQLVRAKRGVQRWFGKRKRRLAGDAT